MYTQIKHLGWKVSLLLILISMGYSSHSFALQARPIRPAVYVELEDPSDLICRAVHERLEIELEIVDNEGRSWIEIFVPYALGYDSYGRPMLVGVRGGSAEGAACSGCYSFAPRWFQDAHGHAVAVGEVASIYLWNIRSVAVREDWPFRPIPNAQEAINERVCGWDCRLD
jgi:hypothetical protein